MEDLQKYLSTAPVLLTIWMTFTAGFIIEINRFFPDMLGLYFQKVFLNSYLIDNCLDLNNIISFNFNNFFENFFKNRKKNV